MTMNTIDAQAFFKDASESFEQLRAVFKAISRELESLAWSGESDNEHKTSVLGLAGAGLHIAEGMAETVGYWADEAAEPWLEDLGTQNKSEANSSAPNGADTSAFVNELCHIKTLLNSAERAIWQDGSPASDRELVMDAVYLMQNASNKISDAIAKA